MFNIREGQKKDCDLIRNYILKLARYEKAEHEMILTAETLANDGFSKNPLFKSLILEFDSEPVGFALFYYRYSTWKGKTLYLEDLYVDSEKRGNGIGLSVMKYLVQHAIKMECKRFEWQVLDWNTPSIEFYKKIGAELDSEWINCKLRESQFEDFLVKF